MMFKPKVTTGLIKMVVQLSVLSYVASLLFSSTEGVIADAARRTALHDEGPDHETSEGMSFLEQAQALQAPESTLLYGGESENLDWWEEHEDLIRKARDEYGRKHEQLYGFKLEFEEAFLDPLLLEAVQQRNLDLLETLLQPTSASNVYKLKLFRPSFVALFLDELDYHEQSGIPLRRPNGMNRYGAILNDLGFHDMVQGVIHEYVEPLALHLFPRYVGPKDVTNLYAFTVRYQPGEDMSLKEHADASVVTVNVCLEPTNQTNVLYFKEHRTLPHEKSPLFFESSSTQQSHKPTFVDLSQPGEAILHLGQIVHGVAPVHDSRSNLVFWLYGEHGQVRVAEYSTDEVERHKELDKLYWLDHTGDASLAAKPETTGTIDEL